MSFLRLSRTLVPALRLRAPVHTRVAAAVKRLPCSANVRRLSTSSSSSSDKKDSKQRDDERARLIAQYPYPWPWGKTFEIQTGKFKLKITIPQDQPAPKQHKLAYKIDPTPPDIPPAPSYFVGPAGKVTHALFDAALKAGTLDTVKQSLDNFVLAYETKREIKNALLNPRTSSDDKLKYLSDVAASVGCDELTIEYILRLQKEKRLAKVVEIARNYGVLISEHRKERFGAVVSAEPLSDTQFEQIYEKMKKLVHADEKLIVTREVEPSLVGGFIIRIGNRAQDLSVAAQIGRMEKHLKEFFLKNKEAVDKVLA